MLHSKPLSDKEKRRQKPWITSCILKSTKIKYYFYETFTKMKEKF